MILFTALSLLSILTSQQVNHTAITPTIARVRTTPEIKTVPSKHSFTNTFKGLGFQISGRIYQTNEGLLDNQVHNNSFYKPSSSCHFYNSQLSLEILNEKIFSEGLNIESSEVSQQRRTAYLLVNDKSYLIDQKSIRTILIYEFSDVGYAEDPRNITITSLGLNDDDQINIALLAVNQVLIVTDGIKFIGIEMKNVSNFWQITVTGSNTVNIDQQFAKFNEILQFELCHIDTAKQMIKAVILWDSVMKVYHFSLDVKKAEVVNELTPPTGKLYTSAAIDHDFYALVEGQLVAYRTRNGSIETTYIDLQSKNCWGMNKYESTLHIICQEGGVNYVAEFFLNQNFVLAKDALFLNRYYTQIDDVRLIFRFGQQDNPKLFMSGDNDLMLTAYGINRQVLMDSNQKQTMSRFKSLGLESIITIANLSNASSTYAVGISTDFIVFFLINEIPSEMECSFDRKDNKMRWNILVEVNTTNCFANGQIQQLQTVCQYSIPFTYYISLFEVDSSKEVTVNIFIYVVLIACGLLLLGCTFHCKSIRTRAIKEIQKKIDALKKKKEHKPI